MKKILLAPDSFKGTMSAETVAALFEKAAARVVPQAECIRIPLADGGEGLVDAFLRLYGGRRVTVSVTGPLGRPADASYVLLPSGTAVMEMAACSGLPLMGDRRDPLNATTYGVGELLRDAANRGVRQVLLGLGGSATNDCGAGMAAALGWRFLDGNGQELPPLAGRLAEVRRIVPPETPLPLTVTAACDVENPLLGDHGATAVFGPQKGVTGETRPLLEEGLSRLGTLLEALTGQKIRTRPGAGAAGGLGAGVLGFLGGTLRPGITLMLDAAGFDQLLEGADLVLTGEGRIDGQTAGGKVPVGVARRCKARGVPCIALCGSIGSGVEAVYEQGITAVFSAVRGPCTLNEIRETCEEDLLLLAENVLRTFFLTQS